MVGTAIEFYDFYAYGTAAANYFPHIFFSAKDNPTVALLMSLLTFAVAFIARPLGSLIFGHFGDRMGRKTTLVVSLMTMGVGTFLIGCLPTYDQVGVGAVAILCLLRFIQASAWAANGPARHWSPPRTRLKTSAHCTAPSRSSAPRSASSCPTAPTSCSNPSTIRTRCWLGGWRVPFLLSAILVIVGLVVRVHMEETPIFRMAQEQKKVVKSPLTEVFRKSWRQVLQATFLVAVTYTLFYTLATWSLAWGHQGAGRRRRATLASPTRNTCSCS